MRVQFQFHKGTIRTTYSSDNTTIAKVFQFHKGTIRTPISQAIIALVFLFQFHKGTIRTRGEDRRTAEYVISIP